MTNGSLRTPRSKQRLAAVGRISTIAPDIYVAPEQQPGHDAPAATGHAFWVANPTDSGRSQAHPDMAGSLLLGRLCLSPRSLAPLPPETYPRPYEQCEILRH